tara:strand:+ start:78 stop:290 length:213 start_codon:yes stop_codon:yes gene_type:complete
MSQRILARATVDVEVDATPIRLGRFRVEVFGDEPHDYVRVYTIQAASDTMSAQEGLRRFVDEIEKLVEKD